MGRVDVAVGLSQEPSFVPEETKSAWQGARKGPAPGGVLVRANDVWREVVKVERGIRTALREADPDTLQAVGVVATAAAVLACAVYFREVGEGSARGRELSVVPGPKLEGIPASCLLAWSSREWMGGWPSVFHYFRGYSLRVAAQD